MIFHMVAYLALHDWILITSICLQTEIISTRTTSWIIWLRNDLEITLKWPCNWLDNLWCLLSIFINHCMRQQQCLVFLSVMYKLSLLNEKDLAVYLLHSVWTGEKYCVKFALIWWKLYAIDNSVCIIENKIAYHNFSPVHLMIDYADT